MIIGEEFAKYFSKNSNSSKKEISSLDKIRIKIARHFNTENDNKAILESVEEGKHHKIGKINAKYATIAGSINGGVIAPMILKNMSKGKAATIGALAGTVIAPSTTY